MVLFLNKKKLQEQKPLVNKTYQGKYDYSGMPLLKEDYRYGFDSLVELGGIKPEKDNKLSLLERITPTAEAAEIQTGRKPIEEIFTEDIERKKFDYQLQEETERLNKPLNIALRTITGIPKQTAIIGKEIGQSITRNVASFFSAETLSPILGKLQDIEKRLEENNITYGFFADEMRDRLLGDLSSDEVVELTGETRGEQVLPAEQRIEKLKNKLKEKANTYREKAKNEEGIAKLVHETLADVLSTEGGALGISSTLVLGSIALDLTGYGGSTKGLAKALTKADNAIDAAKVLMKAGLDEKTALSFADDVVKIKTTKAANSFINNLEVTLKTTKPIANNVKIRPQLADILGEPQVAKQATSISSDLVKTGEQAKGNVLKIIQNTPETTTKKILTSAKETPIEFGLGKGVIQEKIISNESSKLNDLLNRAKITKEESLELFNAFDNPQKYKLSQSLINKNGDDIIKEGRRLNSFLSEQKLSRGVIDRVYDDETYLRTVLETLDGKKPTAEQVARLKNATNQTFRDQLARDLTGFSGKLREKIKTDIRKYRTADERDVILESFGLRTKRDFVNSMSENIRLTTRATSNKEFNDAVRSIAKDGFWVKGKKLVKRDDIIEAYDPFVVSKTRQEIKNNTSKKISKIIDEIKEERILTENEAKIIKDIIYEQKEEAIKELKDSHKYALDDIDNIINFTKQQIARVKNTLLDEKAILLERRTKLIENIRDEAKKELNDFYGKITIKRGELIDKGFKDAGSISGAEPLRGVMLNKKDYRALKEFVEELGESSLEDFAKTIKYFQATLDLFQIPQLLRSSISSSGFIKGCWDWLKAVVKSSGVSVDDMVKSSEFVQQGRFKDFDIDIWNKQLKDMNDNTSWFMKQFKKLGKKTDNMPVVRDVLNGIGAIDEYQFQTVMIPLKTKAWLRKVDELKRLYPNLDERSIMVEAGRFIDDYFGGQQWDKLMARNPRLASRQNQRISRIMIFATDYLTSTMRKLKRETFDAFTKWGVPEGNMARKALAREIIFGLGLINVISYMTRGKSAFENDDPNQFYKLQTNIKDGGGNPYYLDIMGNWGQTWNLINRPIDAIRGKISGIGKIGVSLLADGELKIGEALNPIPFSWRSILETAYNHALGRKPETQIPETIGGGALITLMEFMGLSGTFSGGKSRRQTLMRMIEAESFTPEEVWKYLTGQNVFTNKERITRMIEKDGISDAYSWELEQKKKGYLSEESYPTRDALKTKYGITGSITNNENILRINRMTKEEQRIFIEGYSEKTRELIKDKIKTGSYKKSLSDIFK